MENSEEVSEINRCIERAESAIMQEGLGNFLSQFETVSWGWEEKVQVFDWKQACLDVFRDHVKIAAHEWQNIKSAIGCELINKKFPNVGFCIPEINLVLDSKQAEPLNKTTIVSRISGMNESVRKQLTAAYNIISNKLSDNELESIREKYIHEIKQLGSPGQKIQKSQLDILYLRHMNGAKKILVNSYEELVVFIYRSLTHDKP